jgi:hypothetical protein
LLLPGLAFKILAQKEKTFACAINATTKMIVIQFICGYLTFFLLAYLLTMKINFNNKDGAWYEEFDAGVLTGLAIAYDVSYYLQWLIVYFWNTMTFAHLDTVTTTDLQAAEITLPSNP